MCLPAKPVLEDEIVPMGAVDTVLMDDGGDED